MESIAVYDDALSKQILRTTVYATTVLEYIHWKYIKQIREAIFLCRIHMSVF